MVGGSIRAFWHFGSAEKPQAITGMDLVVLKAGSLRTMYAFLGRGKN